MPLVLDYWHWLILGLILITIEMLVPSFFALLIGLAAIVTGGMVYFYPALSWEYQTIIFAALSIINVVAWQRFYLRNPIATDDPLLNRRGEQYIGRVITLQAPIEDGHGKIRIDDSTWKVSGKDCPAGTKVKIIDLHNVIFDVEVVDD